MDHCQCADLRLGHATVVGDQAAATVVATILGTTTMALLRGPAATADHSATAMPTARLIAVTVIYGDAFEIDPERWVDENPHTTATVVATMKMAATRIGDVGILPQLVGDARADDPKHDERHPQHAAEVVPAVSSGQDRRLDGVFVVGEQRLDLSDGGGARGTVELLLELLELAVEIGSERASVPWPESAALSQHRIPTREQLLPQCIRQPAITTHHCSV